MKKLLFSIVFLNFVLAACTPKLVDITPAIVEKDKPVACTADAKICPDGSGVGRVGPDCEFAACPALKYKILSSADISGLAGPFTFSAEIPTHWEVEAVPTIEAINIYDPNAIDKNNLEKSQIFIRYFKANTFLTLNTVTIFEQIETTNKSRPTVIYDIEKKSGEVNFSSQPLWRNQRHLVTDIRQTDSNPSIFYVIGQRPDLNQEIFDKFLSSLEFGIKKKTSSVAPIADMRSRITKKPFGIFITPSTSPVQPERFSGYHTAIDVEYDDVKNDVEVRAIANGTVVRSGKVSGYGGMLAIRHTIDNTDYLAIYGHLDPASLVTTGTGVNQSQKIGILGDGFTSETDNERKHLHFGLYTGSDTNIKGYVSSREELKNWVDPLSILP